MAAAGTGGVQKRAGRRWLQHGARTVPLVFGLALVVSGFVAAAPAGAAGHFPPHASGGQAPTSTDGGHLTAHAVAPMSKAIIDVTQDSTGVTAEYQYSDLTPCATTTSFICVQWAGGKSAGSFFNFGPVSGPGFYQYGNFANGSLVGNAGQLCGFSWNTEVDQEVLGTDGSLQAAAAQFDCESGTYDISGTVAYNIVPTDPGSGYYIFGQEGELTGFGNDNYLVYLDGAADYNLNSPIVAMAPTPDGGGYWMVGSDGGVFSSGDAGFYGSTGSIKLNKPVVGMAPTHDGNGYWFVASDGGIFAYGDAGFYGSMGGKALNKPIVGMAATPDGNGYWLVASDGGIFSFGDAGFYGSTGSIKLNKPVVGLTPTPSGQGYWFVASDGGIFAYGDARFYGSTGSIHLAAPIVGMQSAPDGNGYWFVASDGGIFNYGSAGFAGSLGGSGITDVAGISLGK